jgi:conjugal transfer pilin signal peptidase TrbI
MLRLFWLLARALRAFSRELLSLPREAAKALAADRGHLTKAMLVVLPVALLAAVLLPRLTLVVTPSIGAWVIYEAPGPIAKGDLVKFILHHPVAGPSPVSVTKYVLCLPGEQLTLIETPSRRDRREWIGHHYCNGALLGISLTQAMNGLKLKHFRWTGTIPAGLVYVGSHHARGFDSRYFGLVPIGSLTRMERLL